MEIIKTKYLTESQFQQVNQLWNTEFPNTLKDRFGKLLEGKESFHHHIIIDQNKNILAWAADFERDNETWFSILVHSKMQGKGLGTLLIKRLKEETIELNGWVIDHDTDKKENGQIYTSPLSFYINQGFKVLKDQRIDNEMLKAVKVRWVS